jgi:outer membrane protein assembly factor BamD (BamD/ComL family)
MEDRLRKFAVIILAFLPLLACGKKLASEKELYEQGAKYEATQDYNKALECYQTIVDKYPKSENRYKAMFMVAYINSDYLKDTKKAIKGYDELLKEYPKCDLADDAQTLRAAAISGKDLMSVFQDSVKTK